MAQRAGKRNRLARSAWSVAMLLCLVALVSGCNYIFDTVPSLRPGAGDEAAAATATQEAATPTDAPPPTPTQTPTPMPTPDLSDCTLNAAYVADVSIPDNTEMTPGQKFIKTWEIQNTGTCPWTRQFSLNFVGGDNLSDYDSVPLSTCAPGDSMQVSLEMTAPENPGTYRSTWQVCAAGQCAGTQVYVQIVVR